MAPNPGSARCNAILRKVAVQQEAVSAGFFGVNPADFAVAPETVARAQTLIQLGNLTGENPVPLGIERISDLDNPPESREAFVELMEYLRESCRDGQLQEQTNLIYATVSSTFIAPPDQHPDRHREYDNLPRTRARDQELKDAQNAHAPAEGIRGLTSHPAAAVRRLVENLRSVPQMPCIPWARTRLSRSVDTCRAILSH